MIRTVLFTPVSVGLLGGGLQTQDDPWTALRFHRRRALVTRLKR